MNQHINGLTKKQIAFVYEYIKDFNGTAAAKRAGYSRNRASEIAWQLLQKTTVKELINRTNEELQQQLRIQFINDAVEARKTLYKIMVDSNSSDRDKIAAAKDFLDRAGFRAIAKSEFSSNIDSKIEIKFVNKNY